MSPATYLNKTCDSLQDEFYNSFWISSAIHFEQDMILSSARRVSFHNSFSAFHLNKTCDSSTIHWTRCDSEQGQFLHRISQFLRLSILNKTLFLSKKGFFYYTFSISSLAHWTKKWMNTVAWLNEYSSMKEATRHGKGESAIRFLEHKLQLCQLSSSSSSSSSSSHLVGGWSLRREETRELATG